MNINKLTKLLALTAMIVCASLACADSPKRQSTRIATRWNAPDSAARAIMGNRLSELLLTPKKVEMYTVTYRDSAHINNAPIERDFVIDSLIHKLTKEQTAVLDYILLTDSRNFSVDTTAIPMIPHRPAYAFKFINKKDNAIVWYSPGDYTWGIRYEGRNLFWYNVSDPESINRFCRNFTKK